MCSTRQATYLREILVYLLALLPGASYRIDLSNTPTTIVRDDQKNADQRGESCCFKQFWWKLFFRLLELCSHLKALLPWLLLAFQFHLCVALFSATAACPPFVTHSLLPMSISIPLPTGPELGGFGKLLQNMQ